MNVDVFTLCDFARAEGNKMTIVGAFNRIVARQAPITYQHCGIAAIMRFDQGQKTIRLSFIDADGRPVMPRRPQDGNSGTYGSGRRAGLRKPHYEPCRARVPDREAGIEAI